jgi:hypothetical protein
MRRNEEQDMSPTLERALAEIAKLSEDEQEKFAKWILAELADERRWDASFAASHDALAELANEALADFHAGRTQPLDPDNL